LFDGAKPGARIRSVQRPAVLARALSGAWQLTEKGRVSLEG